MAEPLVKPRIGVSACLLGKEVRFDGGHRRSSFVSGSIAEHVELVAVCPEVESGMHVPREALRLVGDRSSPRLVGNRSGQDFTVQVERWGSERLEQLAALDLNGFVLKKDSPSCGVERVRLYPEGSAQPSREGSGLFASLLMRTRPDLPLSEEGWLTDSAMCESFLDRVFTHQRIRASLKLPSRSTLVDLQSAHKFLYMAHSPKGQVALGRMVAEAADPTATEIGRSYLLRAMEVLAVKPSRGKHVNVLQHILGFFKRILEARERIELSELIADFGRGIGSLAIPLALLRHHVWRHGVEGWLSRQVYFEPFPRSIASRGEGVQ